MARNSSTRIRKNRIDPTMVVANEIDMPEAQRIKGNLVLVDIANHGEDDHRAMIRVRAAEPDRKGSGKGRQTIRKLTKLEKLNRAGIISEREAKACQWYANAHAMRYDTTGTTANYGESNGSPRTDFDHMPKTKPQWEALEHYTTASQSICPTVRPMFERVVLGGHVPKYLPVTFRETARKLLKKLEEMMAF